MPEGAVPEGAVPEGAVPKGEVQGLGVTEARQGGEARG